MSPTPRPSQLAHVEVPLRVSVERVDWVETGDALDNAVLRDAPLIHSVRRDQDKR